MKQKRDLSKNTSDLLDFVSFTHKFNNIKRVLFATGEDRRENDSEHSFQLALVSWYLTDVLELDLNITKVIKYALAHDLVEVYAGDVYFHTKDKKLKKEKKSNEVKAALKIRKEFSGFKDLGKVISNYESKVDQESKFVYALDKVLPVVNIYLDGGRSWIRDKVTYKMIRTKDKKIAVSKSVEQIWKEIIILLENKQSELFPDKG
jgi:putative hydrolases of HD superfamily